MEGLTVAAIILGAILGGIMVGPHSRTTMFRSRVDLPFIDTGIDTPAELAIVVILVLYVIAAVINLYIPRVAIDHKLPKKTPLYHPAGFLALASGCCGAIRSARCRSP